MVSSGRGVGMSKWDEVRRYKATASAKLQDTDLAELAADAVVGAAGLLQGAEDVARRSGLTSRDGSISKLKVARAAMSPAATGRKLLIATSEEIQERRRAPQSGPEQMGTATDEDA